MSRARKTREVAARGAPGPPATTRALARLSGAEAVVLVEGISDQIAVETLAARRGRDLAAERVVIVPIGGAHAMGRHLTLLGPAGAGVRVVGLCDVGEENVVRRAVTSAGVGLPETRADLERLGFYFCVEDLEDELIRAVGAARVQALIESQGDARSLRSLQRQPEWRGHPEAAQLRRFFGSGARRKLRYARLLAEAVELDRVPHPLEGVLSRAYGGS